MHCAKRKRFITVQFKGTMRIDSPYHKFIVKSQFTNALQSELQYSNSTDATVPENTTPTRYLFDGHILG